MISKNYIAHWEMFANDLREISKPLRNSIEVKYFGHAMVTSDRDYFIISTDERPLEFTHQKYKSPVSGLINYENVEDGILLPNYDDMKLGWENGMSLELKEKFNLINPMMITKKTTNFIEFFYFTLDAPNAYEKYCNNLEVFENYIFYYKDKCRKIIDKCRHTMNKYQVQIPNYNASDDLVLNNTFIVDRYWMNYQGKERRITRSEFKVLDKIAHGKTVKESSIEIGCASKTIDNHIRNMKERNRLFTTSDLIKMYWENRVIK